MTAAAAACKKNFSVVSDVGRACVFALEWTAITRRESVPKVTV